MCITRIVATLAALTFAVQTALTAQSVDPNDVGSIDQIISAVYDVISGPAGQTRDWDRWDGLFAERALLSSVGRRQDGSYGRRVMIPESCRESSGSALEANGFFEVEINRVTESYGMIAHAFSTYESRRSLTDAEPFARGINSFQLMNDGSRWWVVSVHWQGEGPDNPLPTKYIGG
jgi:hypothetical protein